MAGTHTKCKDHPKYLGKQNPRCDCQECWEIRRLITAERVCELVDLATRGATKSNRAEGLWAMIGAALKDWRKTLP